MLGHYIGGCMVSISNINNGIKEPTHGYQICNTNHIFILGGYLRLKKSLYTQVIIWISVILNHIDTKVILHRYDTCMKSCCMIYRHQ